MNTENVITGITEDEIWQQIDAQVKSDPELLEYTAHIEQSGWKILLNVDIDLGGGFESGYEITTISAPLHSLHQFKFALHAKHFTDEIGKFFGMQDVVLGFEEFDKKFIIKTNDAARAKELFSDASIRNTLLSLDDFSFGVHSHHNPESHKKGPFLELLIETGITDPQTLRQLYHAFFAILSGTDTADDRL